MQAILSSHSKIAGSQRESGIFTAQNLFDVTRQYCDLSEEQVGRILSRARDIVEFFDAIAREVLLREGGERFLEKTPQHILKLPTLIRYFPRAQFLCVFRDGRDCFCSARDHKGIPQGDSVTRYARYWRRCIDAQLEVSGLSNVLPVRYEELTQAPEQVIRGVMAFLELSYEEGQVSPAAYSRDRRSNLPEFSKLKQPINGGSTQRWKRDMSREDASSFIRIAGRQLGLMGYELD